MKFKSKCKYKSKTKMLSRIIFLTFLLVTIFTFFLLNKFNHNITNNLINISKSEVNNITYKLITDKINNNLINKDTVKDILIINKNKNDEILYVDFDLDKAYKVLDNVSNVLTAYFSNIENGDISISYLDNSMSHELNSLVLNIPMGSALNSFYFHNLGPKVPVKINFIGSVLTNLETKITNYGLNNALVEMFVYINFNIDIITPFKNETINFKYDAIIASMMIEGSVPSIYGGSIERSSNIHSESITN